MRTTQLQQHAAQLRQQAEVKEHLAINAMRLAANAASNNIMLSGVGVTYQVGANQFVRPSGVVSLLIIFLSTHSNACLDVG